MTDRCVSALAKQMKVALAVSSALRMPGLMFGPISLVRLGWTFDKLVLGNVTFTFCHHMYQNSVFSCRGLYRHYRSVTDYMQKFMFMWLLDVILINYDFTALERRVTFRYFISEMKKYSSYWTTVKLKSYTARIDFTQGCWEHRKFNPIWIDQVTNFYGVSAAVPVKIILPLV